MKSILHVIMLNGFCGFDFKATPGHTQSLLISDSAQVSVCWQCWGMETVACGQGTYLDHCSSLQPCEHLFCICGSGLFLLKTCLKYAWVHASFPGKWLILSLYHCMCNCFSTYYIMTVTTCLFAPLLSLYI